MVQAEGMFAAPQMVQTSTNKLAGLLDTQTPEWVGSGKVFTFRLYACQVCGFIELVDSVKD